MLPLENRTNFQYPIIAIELHQLQIIFPMVLVDENPYYYAAIGGIILGIATSLNYILRGKVTGMSGIVFGIITFHKEEIPQKISIVGGMLLASGIFFDIFGYGTSNNFTPFGPADAITNTTSYIGYGLAGLLVGFGTKMSNGCTSGHGLCGLSRLSIRSIVAVCVFLVSALAISTLRYHVTLGPFSEPSLNPLYSYNHLISANICLAIGCLLPIIGGWMKTHSQHHKMSTCEVIVDQIITFTVGLIFGFGLLVAGMVRRSNILGFLGLGSQWNPSLMFVLGCGVLVNLFTFQYMLRVKKLSLLGHDLFNPNNTTIDWRLVVGATCFGLGWGIGGLCPGPAIMQFSIFTIPIHIIWFGFLIIGMLIAKYLEHYLNELKKREKEQKEKEEIEHAHHKSAKEHSHHHHHKHPHRGTHKEIQHKEGEHHQTHSRHKQDAHDHDKKHNQHDNDNKHHAPHHLPPIQIKPHQNANQIILHTQMVTPSKMVPQSQLKQQQQTPSLQNFFSPK